MKFRIYFPLVLLVVIGCRDSKPTHPEVDELLQLMNDRLAIMPEVAKAKVYLGLPVDDAKREESLLLAAEVDANKNGLDPKFVREFFTAQFEASKMIQRREMKTLPRPEPSEEGMKQAGKQFEEARTKINAINVKTIAVLVKLKNIPAEERRKLIAERSKELLSSREQEERDAALKPLLEW